MTFPGIKPPPAAPDGPARFVVQPWLGALVVAAGSFILYATTSPPGITWGHHGEDGSEFAAAGRMFGIPHPSGYPLFTMLLRLLLLGGGDPAWRVTLFNNLVGAATVFLAVLVFTGVARRALGAAVAPSVGDEDGTPAISGASTAGGAPAGDWTGFVSPATVAGAIAGGIFGASPVWWSQANIIEVYPLHLLFVVTALHLALTFGDHPRRLWLLAWVIGLGLTHHLQMTLLGPPLLVLVWAGWPRRRREDTPGPAAPTTGDPRPPGADRATLRILATGAVLFLLPLTLYAVLLVRSRFNPPIDWGNPESLRQLAWMATGQEYRSFMFASPLKVVLERAGDFLGRQLPVQFAWTALPLGLPGIVALWRRGARAPVVALLLYMALQVGAAINYNIPDADAYFIPVTLAWAAFGAAGAAVLLQAAGMRRRTGGIAAALALAAMLAGPVISLPRTHRANSLTHDTEAMDYARLGIEMLPRGGLVLAQGDGRTFSLWYEQALQRRYDVTVVSRPLLAWPWYVQNLKQRDPALVDTFVGRPAAEYTREFLVNNLSRRPVYLTTLDRQLMRNYRIAPEGPLFRVRGVRQPFDPPQEQPPCRSIDLSGAANADYRLDPFTAGGRDSLNLVPGLGDQPVCWGALPFALARPQEVTGRPSIIATGGLATFEARLPLSPEPTPMVVLVVGGHGILRQSLKLGEARVHYATGDPTVVEIRSFENVWDISSAAIEVEIPEDVVAWQGPRNRALSALPIRTDPERTPVALEIVRESPPDASAARASFSVFAAAQVLLPPVRPD